MGKPTPFKILHEGIYFTGVNFPSLVRTEGGKKEGRTIAIPSRACKELTARGWDQKWIEIQIEDSSFIVRARFNSATGVIAIPKRHQALAPVGETIDVIARNPSARRARSEGWVTPTTLDWAALATEDVFPSDEQDNGMLLHNNYDRPFEMLRRTPWADVMWMLGFYYADGAKSATNFDWSIVNRGPLHLARVVRALDVMGIPPARTYLEVIQAPGQTAEEAAAIYHELGVTITANRPRVGRGYDAGILHVRSSLYFKKMLCAIYEKMEASVEDLPPEACRDFALGFLAGDGTITLKDTGIILRIFGANPTQARCVTAALNKGMSWTLPIKTLAYKATGNGDEQIWSIDALQAAQLIEVNAFAGMDSNKRLCFGLERQTEGLLNVWRQFRDAPHFSTRDSVENYGTVSALRLHGYLEGEKDRLKFTEKSKRLVELLEKLARR